MFIRKKMVHSKRTGISYPYYQLIESRNTEKGPRSTVLLHIGRLDINDEEQKLLSTLIDRKVKGFCRSVRFSDKIEQLAEQIYIKYMHSLSKLSESGQDQINEVSNPDNQLSVSRESIDVSIIRNVGSELLSLHFWKQLKLDKILKQCGFNNKESELAKIAILGRLLSPGSELHTLNWFNEHSSLGEFFKVVKPGISKDSLYRIADKILEQKEGIERRLRDNLKSLHSLFDQVYLYDLTNTYFEGNKANSDLCKRGKSKEKRDDCPLVTLALVVDQNGFPVYSKIYNGNQSEPKTLPEILSAIYEEQEDLIDRLALPAVIMDRGIATHKNLEYMKKKRYNYFVIERRDTVKDFKNEFQDLASFEETLDNNNSKLYLKKMSLAEDLTKVLVYSVAKSLKEIGITSKREQRFLEEAAKLIISFQRGYLKDRDKIMVRIGRIREKYSAVSGQYDFNIQSDPLQVGRVLSIDLIETKHKSSKSEFPGCYVIETNNCDLSAKQVWDFYMKLSEVESAFRAMKSELGTRPIYHRTDSRIEAHLFYSVLAYAIMKSITYKLNQKGYHASWSTIKESVRSHKRATITFTDSQGYSIHIRQTSLPEQKAAKIYSLLGIKVSKHQVTTKHQV